MPITLLANNFDQTETGFQIDIPIAIDPSNLDALDPLFVDAANGDLHLTAGSPMIDAGHPQTTDLPATDLDGVPRVLGAAVDIGAYEYDDGSSGDADFVVTRVQPTPPRNGTINLSVVVENVGTESGDAGTLTIWANQDSTPSCGANGDLSQTVGTLEPGTGKILSFDGLVLGDPGTNTFRAFVDSDCVTPESDEDNNQFTRAYRINSKADAEGSTLWQ